MLSVSELARNARRLAVLHDLVDPQNVGSIFRAAAALGMDGIVLSPDCADPLYRRAVRVSMGAVLSLPYARFEESQERRCATSGSGFSLLALTPDPVHAARRAVGRGQPRARALLGTEGEGLPPAWLAESDVRVRIPMARGIDSLNVGSAAAVAFYGLSLAGRTLDL